MQTCSKCGAVNNSDSKFCYACGNAIQNPPVVAPMMQPQQPASHPVQPIVPQQPSSPVQPTYPTSPQVPVQHGPHIPSAQPNLPYTPVQSGSASPTYPQQPPYSNTPAGSLYVEPPKKKNSALWIMVGVGVIVIAAVLFALVRYTPLMSMFSNKSDEFINYYNNTHIPIYREEANVVEQLNQSVFVNDADWNYVYGATDQWIQKLQNVNASYRNASVASDEIQQLNDLSIQRSSMLHNTIFSLKKAIELNDQNMFNEDFMKGIENYNNLYYEWEALIDTLMKKYGISFED